MLMGVCASRRANVYPFSHLYNDNKIDTLLFTYTIITT